MGHKELPTVITQSTIDIMGFPLTVCVLSNGQRVIEESSLNALFAEVDLPPQILLNLLPKKEKFTQKCDICHTDFRHERVFETPICDSCDAKSSDYGDSI